MGRKKTGYETVINTRLQKETIDALERTAKSRNMTRYTLVRQILEQYAANAVAEVEHNDPVLDRP